MDESPSAPTPSGRGPAGVSLRLCAVRFTKLTVEAEPLGQLPSRPTTRRSRARQGAGPSQGFFRPRKRLTQENYEKANLEYKLSYFNNLTHNR